MTAGSTASSPKPKPRKRVSASAAAREAEAGDGFVDIEHRGVSLRIPVKGKVPVAAIDAFLRGDNYEGTKQQLGAEQWKLLSDAGMAVEEIDELGEKLKHASGN